MVVRKVLSRLFLTLAILALTGAVTVVVTTRTQAAPAAGQSGLVTSNDIWLEAGISLPVFQFQAPQVNGDGAQQLAVGFEAIGGQPIQQDSYGGYSRFSILNQATGSLLEQYGASGGFNAYNAPLAFGETSAGFVDAKQAQEQACNFLLNNDLFPDTDLISTPDVQFCDFDFSANPYRVSLIYAATAPGPAAAADAHFGDGDDTVIGALVQVPMMLNTGIYSQIPQVPLAGAGGHLSLLFRTTAPTRGGFSLDDSVPGLAAVAMPFYGHRLDFLENYPAADPVAAQQQVTDQVWAAFPDASEVNVPAPALVYEVADASIPQRALEPMLNFSGVEVTVDGQVLVLRDINVSALSAGGGFGPDVLILLPTNGSLFDPAASVSLAGDISGGAAPYTYTWQLNDGTVINQGVLATPGPVGGMASSLPASSHGGLPAPVLIQLLVEDSVGAVRQAAVSVEPAVAPSVFLPGILRQAPALAATPAQAAAPAAATAVYRFGVEAGSDYPPYGAGGSDLPGVVPDASGFGSAMLGYGWSRTFNWWNASAWERDWRDCSLGGGDCTYGVDRTDFVYYAGHGSNGGISLPSNVDSSWFPGSNARFQQARWVAFSSCLTLRAQWTPASSAPIRQWFNAFQGAHMLLGFNSLMADVAFGPRLVDNMRMPTFFGIPLPWAQRTIREAWVLTAFQMNAGRPAYIYAVGSNGVNPADNKLPGPNDGPLPRPFPVASYHWVWWND